MIVIFLAKEYAKKIFEEFIDNFFWFGNSKLHKNILNQIKIDYKNSTLNLKKLKILLNKLIF